MLCENCKKASATFHYRHSENGIVTEKHLCSECAADLGYVQGGYITHSGIESFFKSPFSYFLDGNVKGFDNKKPLVCPKCGMTEVELRSKGLIGCAQCYDTFSGLIEGILDKIQLSNEYKGRIPESASKRISIEKRISALEKDMQRAVDSQEYEEAARIRDALRVLREEKIKSEEEGL